MTPGPSALQGAVGRYDFTKTFYGDLQADGEGLMLASGDPATGAAGYVAIETVRGSLGNRRGGFALQQLGMVQAGAQTLHYEVIPGSGNGEPDGITGTFHLTVEADGTHQYELEYDLEANQR